MMENLHRNEYDVNLLPWMIGGRAHFTPGEALEISFAPFAFDGTLLAQSDATLTGPSAVGSSRAHSGFK
jgi:hypothetical protein